MISAATSDALDRIATRASDVLAGYTSGFEPQRADAAGQPASLERSQDPLSVVAPERHVFPRRAGRRDALLARRRVHVRRRNAPRARRRRRLGHGARRARGAPSANARSRSIARSGASRTSASNRTERSAMRARRSIRAAANAASNASHSGASRSRASPRGRKASRFDATHFEAPRGVVPLVGQPSDGSFGPLRTYSRDTGRLDLLAGLQRLQEAYLSFEALARGATARGGSSGRRSISSSDRRARVRPGATHRRRPARAAPPLVRPPFDAAARRDVPRREQRARAARAACSAREFEVELTEPAFPDVPRAPRPLSRGARRARPRPRRRRVRHDPRGRRAAPRRVRVRARRNARSASRSPRSRSGRSSVS